MPDPDVRRQLRETVARGRRAHYAEMYVDTDVLESLLDALDEADEKRDFWRATAEEAQEAAGEWLAAAEETLAERTRLAEALAVAVEELREVAADHPPVAPVDADPRQWCTCTNWSYNCTAARAAAALARIDTLTASQGEPT